MSHNFDFIVFGASGFTGEFVVEQLLRLSEVDESITWAVAGRDVNKLKKCLRDAKANTNIVPKLAITIITCDVSDAESLAKMASQAKIVLNCVGPYRFFGEAVVKACIEAGTHHLDISGEPQYLESTQLNYHSLAKEKNVYVIGACGFDSIPAEVGLLYLQQTHPNIIFNEVECFIRMETGRKGLTVNYGTWQSAIHGFAHRGELTEIRRKLYPERLPRPQYRQLSRGSVSYNKDLGGWLVPFAGSDRSVVMRSQYYLHQQEKQKPIQFMPYFYLESFWKTILLVIMGIVFGFMANFNWTRRFLEKYPRFFSGGVFTHEGPSREQIRDNRFTLRFDGKGWLTKDDGVKESKEKATMEGPPKEKVTVAVSGPDFGYVSCAICLIQCGLVILKEMDSLPPGGGVYPPGAAFAKTTLVDRLANNGLNFRVISSVDKKD